MADEDTIDEMKLMRLDKRDSFSRHDPKASKNEINKAVARQGRQYPRQPNKITQDLVAGRIKCDNLWTRPNSRQCS